MLIYCKLPPPKMTDGLKEKDKRPLFVSVSVKNLMTDQAGTFAADKTTMSQLSKEKAHPVGELNSLELREPCH